MSYVPIAIFLNGGGQGTVQQCGPRSTPKGNVMTDVSNKENRQNIFFTNGLLRSYWYYSNLTKSVDKNKLQKWLFSFKVGKLQSNYVQQ